MSRHCWWDARLHGLNERIGLPYELFQFLIGHFAELVYMGGFDLLIPAKPRIGRPGAGDHIRGPARERPSCYATDSLTTIQLLREVATSGGNSPRFG